MPDATHPPAPLERSEPARADFPYFAPLQTRWHDNDAYGHVNNVVYYAYFDTIINEVLVRDGGLDVHAGPVIGLCVESQCRYVAPAAFPDRLEAGLRVDRLGTSSVTYALAIFRCAQTGDPATALCAFGRFVHVFVDRGARRPVPIPATLRAALQRLAFAPTP